MKRFLFYMTSEASVFSIFFCKLNQEFDTLAINNAPLILLIAFVLFPLRLEERNSDRPVRSTLQFCGVDFVPVRTLDRSTLYLGAP